MKIHEILGLSMEERANHCDQVCIKLVMSDDPEAIDIMFEMIQKSLDKGEIGFSIWNATSVGNIARVAVSGNSEELRNLAQQLLNKYTAWFYVSWFKNNQK